MEKSEKRKDAQVARDYRIPVPLGLDEHRASQLAERLARFIMGELSTPVSVGLHCDATVDAFGDVKPPEKQGYHAHLYFPSRPLLLSAPSCMSRCAKRHLQAGTGYQTPAWTRTRRRGRADYDRLMAAVCQASAYKGDGDSFRVRLEGADGAWQIIRE